MNSNLTPLEVPTVKEAAYRRILHAIVSGKLRPGVQVTIAQLAEELGVSLMPVREAVRMLEAGNFISVQKNRRIAIKALSESELKELLQIRLKLECMAAAKATRSCTAGTVGELEHLMDEMEAAEDTEEYLEKNRQFHHTLYRGANMPILLDVIRDLWWKVSPYLHISIAESVDHKVQSMTYHQGMMQGIREREPKQVCRWLSVDLKQAASLVAGLLDGEKTKKEG